MAVVFQKTSGLVDKQTHYCPGCTHGIIHRLVAEVLEELGWQKVKKEWKPPVMISHHAETISVPICF